jgi:hypothetical protein
MHIDKISIKIKPVMLKKTNKAPQFYGNMASLKGRIQREEERSESFC